MGDKSGIEWTDATWNPVAAFDRTTKKRGWFCIKKSEGCRNCYAEAMNKWRGNGLSYSAGNLKHIEFKLVNLNLPLRWKRSRNIFVNSMTDLFLPAIPDNYIEKIFNVMYEASWHGFQILTKHPDRMYDFISRSAFLSNAPLGNVSLGVSCETQKEFDERWPWLRQTPAAIRSLSLEPLLGPIDARAALIADHYNCEEGTRDDPTPIHRCWPIADQLIVGGESGPKARPTHPDWVRSLRNQCLKAGKPFFFKQWGAFCHWDQFCQYDTDTSKWIEPRWFNSKMPGVWIDESGKRSTRENEDAIWLYRVGKKRAGRLLDGMEWNQFPRGDYERTV
jgi:protein gp37